MKRISQLISWLALVGILVSACVFYCDGMDLARARQWMLAFTVAWFLATPVWMEHGVGG